MRLDDLKWARVLLNRIAGPARSISLAWRRRAGWRRILLVGAPLLVACAAGIVPTASAAGERQTPSYHEPAPGTAERREILDALRDEIRRQLGLHVTFMVVHLKVEDGWAWAHTRPQSPDGLNHYEDVSALLHLEHGAWQVVTLSDDGPAAVRRLYPAAPAGIFP
jgi:hypothetical protein